MASENGLSSSLLGGNRPKSRNLFATSTSAILAVLLVLLAVFTKYTEKHQTDDDVQRFYTWYLHVGVSPHMFMLSLATSMSNLLQWLKVCRVQYFLPALYMSQVCYQHCSSYYRGMPRTPSLVGQASECRHDAAAQPICILKCKSFIPAGGHHDFCRLWVPDDLPEALQLQCTWAQFLLFLHCHIGSPLSHWSCATGEVHGCKITLVFLCFLSVAQKIVRCKDLSLRLNS